MAKAGGKGKKRKQIFLCNLMGKATTVETVGEGVEEFKAPYLHSLHPL